MTSNKYLIIPNDRLLFLLSKLTSETPVFLNVGTIECFFSKAAISSH